MPYICIALQPKEIIANEDVCRLKSYRWEIGSGGGDGDEHSTLRVYVLHEDGSEIVAAEARQSSRSAHTWEYCSTSNHKWPAPLKRAGRRATLKWLEEALGVTAASVSHHDLDRVRQVFRFDVDCLVESCF